MGAGLWAGSSGGQRWPGCFIAFCSGHNGPTEVAREPSRVGRSVLGGEAAVLELGLDVVAVHQGDVVDGDRLRAGVLALGTLALAVVGWRRSNEEGRPAWILILPALYLNLFLAALLALGRYSVPILPPLLVVSAFGIDSILSWRAAARRRA